MEMTCDLVSSEAADFDRWCVENGVRVPNRDVLPPITVLDPQTGKVSDMPHAAAKERIAQGMVIATEPSDRERAKAWAAELRDRVVEEAVRRGWHADIPELDKYEAWCATRNMSYALPIRIEHLVAYMLSLASDGVHTAALSTKASSLDRLQQLTGHPPRLLAKRAINDYSRAIAFAKTTLQGCPIAELAREAPRKALELFSDGMIPLRWSNDA